MLCWTRILIHLLKLRGRYPYRRILVALRLGLPGACTQRPDFLGAELIQTARARPLEPQEAWNCEKEGVPPSGAQTFPLRTPILTETAAYVKRIFCPPRAASPFYYLYRQRFGKSKPLAQKKKRRGDSRFHSRPRNLGKVREKSGVIEGNPISVPRCAARCECSN